MGDMSRRHAEVLEELAEWWEDISRDRVGSRAVLVPVPRGWGRTTLLASFVELVEGDEQVSLCVSLPGGLLPEGLGLQAAAIRERFGEHGLRHRAAEVLGMDRRDGIARFGLGVGSLFVSGVAAAAGFLLAGMAAEAGSRLWDDRPAGHEGAVARQARAAAAISAQLPVVVAIDDADDLELDLAVVLIENLIARANGQVLVVATVTPGSDLVEVLTSRARYGLTEHRVHLADADPDMSELARAELASELSPGLSAIAAQRIGKRTRTYSDVFTVAASERLAELGEVGPEGGDDSTVVVAVDEVVNGQLDRNRPSARAVVLAWAGGILHTTQAERALVAWNPSPTHLEDGDALRDGDDVTQFEDLMRLADPASPRLSEQVTALAAGTRRRMAAAILDAAIDLGRDPNAGLAERVVAGQAVDRVRADLRDQDRERLVAVQLHLIRGLEALGDHHTAYQVVQTTLSEYLERHTHSQPSREGDNLTAALLRLSRTAGQHEDDPLIEAAVNSARAGGAAVQLEARLWAAISLLGQPGRRAAALQLVDQVASELLGRTDLGRLGHRWRLLLAFHAGRVGYPAVTQELLAPLVADAQASEVWDAARAVLAAVGGPGADTRLQIILLEAELSETDPDADDDQLRLHSALGSAYASQGDFSHALGHGLSELPLRLAIQGADHPGTLNTRAQIASRLGHSVHPAKALRMLEELLPDQTRVLGRDHPATLAGRDNVAVWMGRAGRPRDALQLARDLLPDLQRVRGRVHPETLAVRGNIASLTEQCGRDRDALRLYRELLPDLQQAYGDDHRMTVIARDNIASLTGSCGHPDAALQEFLELRSLFLRVYGPDHPETLTNRGNVAFWTGESGHPEEALRLYRELLPDRERVLGPDHPKTLETRLGVAHWTGESGHPDDALRLYRDLLPGLQKAFGDDHPTTLVARDNIASETGRSGRPAAALQQFLELRSLFLRVYGPDHPETLTNRGNIASWTGRSGDPEEALRLYRELLPDRERVFGPDHPSTLQTRLGVVYWTSESGHPEEALRLHRELLPDLERTLGPHHRYTLNTLMLIARLAGDHET